MAVKNENIKRVVLRNAPENHQMVAPNIQKDIANCFSEVLVAAFVFFSIFMNLGNGL
jgi:hypothetical protein